MNDQFKKAIKAYLDNRAANDELFAKAYAKSNKSIDECCTYIMGEAKKKASKGCAVIDDPTVYGWAVHYYDESDIVVEKVDNAMVVAPDVKVELTEEEKAEAKQKAIALEVEKQRAALHQPKPKAKKTEPEVLPSLFD